MQNKIVSLPKQSCLQTKKTLTSVCVRPIETEQFVLKELIKALWRFSTRQPFNGSLFAMKGSPREMLKLFADNLVSALSMFTWILIRGLSIGKASQQSLRNFEHFKKCEKLVVCPVS